MGYNTPNGVSGSGRHSAVVASLPFDPKIVSALEKDRTSKLYSRWRPSNKHLHTDQFSSATLPLKFYYSFSTTSTIGKKTLDEVLTVILGRKGLTTISSTHLCLTWQQTIMFTSPMNHQLVQSTATVADTASRCRQRALHPLPS